MRVWQPYKHPKQDSFVFLTRLRLCPDVQGQTILGGWSVGLGCLVVDLKSIWSELDGIHEWVAGDAATQTY